METLTWISSAASSRCWIFWSSQPLWWRLLTTTRTRGPSLLVYFVADCLQLDIGWRWWQFGWQRTVNMSYHHNWYLGKYTPYHHHHLHLLSSTATYQAFPGKNWRQHKQYHVLHRLKILPFSGCVATGDRGWYRRLEIAYICYISKSSLTGGWYNPTNNFSTKDH